jgi:hypothetical protein
MIMSNLKNIVFVVFAPLTFANGSVAPMQARRGPPTTLTFAEASGAIVPESTIGKSSEVGDITLQFGTSKELTGSAWTTPKQSDKDIKKPKCTKGIRMAGVGLASSVIVGATLGFAHWAGAFNNSDGNNSGGFMATTTTTTRHGGSLSEATAASSAPADNNTGVGNFTTNLPSLEEEDDEHLDVFKELPEQTKTSTELPSPLPTTDAASKAESSSAEDKEFNKSQDSQGDIDDIDSTEVTVQQLVSTSSNVQPTSTPSTTAELISSAMKTAAATAAAPSSSASASSTFGA